MAEKDASSGLGPLELPLLAICGAFRSARHALESSYQAKLAGEAQQRAAGTGTKLTFVLSGRGAEQQLPIETADLFPVRPVRLVGMSVEFALAPDQATGQGGFRMVTQGPDTTGLRKGVLTIGGHAEPIATLHIDDKRAWQRRLVE